VEALDQQRQHHTSLEQGKVLSQAVARTLPETKQMATISSLVVEPNLHLKANTKFQKHRMKKRVPLSAPND
jgi:hypothetical protein